MMASDESVPEMLHQIEIAAIHHREQLGKLAQEFAKLHSVHPESLDGRDYQSVILDGVRYEEAHRMILNRKLSQYAQGGTDKSI
jgi:hypothetical protein